METKKSLKADLESKKPIFFQIGLVAILFLSLMAFEWKRFEKELKIEDFSVGKSEIDEIVLQTKEIKPPEPPPPPQQTTVLNIVDNNVEVTNNVEIDADENTQNVEYQKVEEEEVVDKQETEIFQIVEDQPDFPGGDESRMKFLQENIKYPQIANESGIEGRVILTFVVEKNGNITDIKVLKDIGGGCGEEAVRVAKIMPKWKPGKQRGKAVRVQFNMPIMFQLQQ